jgi:hypothetical protein
MKNLFLTLSLLVSVALNGNSQVTWEKLFSKKGTDVFRSVREVPAGGYIVAGYTSDSTVNDTDAFVVRLNTSGDTIWTFTYNGPLSKKDLFYKVIPTSDNGFALCGYTNSVTGLSDDMLILKLNSSGQQQWVKFYGGSGKERAQDILETPSGNLCIVGYTTSAPAQYYDAIFIRTNSSGDTLWTRRYGSTNYDDANTLKRLSDGGFILGGQSSNGANGLDQYLIRTNSSGDTIWTKRFGTPLTDNIESIALATGGFVLAGGTNSLTSGDNGYLVKTDTGGTVLWTKIFGGDQPDDFHTVFVTADDGLVACGTTRSYGQQKPNMWLMRTTSNGDSIWAKTYGGDNHDHGYCGFPTSDGGFIATGHTGSFGFNYEEGYVVKTDTGGNVSTKLTYTTVYSIVSPNTSTCGTANTPIRLMLRNFGNQPIANIPVTVEISGSHTQTINQTFSASSDTVTLSTTLNTSAGGTYTIYAYTNNDNDVYPAQNSISGTFTIVPTATAPSVTDSTRCGNGTLTLSANSSGAPYWFTVASGGTSVFSGPNYTTPVLSSTTTYYVQSELICASARVPVVATVNPVSIDPITTGDSRCGSGILNLAASAFDSITWYNAPSGGSVVGTGTTFTTPFLTTSTNYYAQASNGLCPSNRIVANAIVSSVANDPVTVSGSRCGSGTVSLTANSIDPIIWYDAPASGSQVGTGLTFTTPPLAVTTVYYAQADNGCLSNRVPATATINTLAPDPITIAGQNCGPGAVTLSATSTNPVTWYDAATGGNQVAFGYSIQTPVILSTDTFFAQAFDGTCPSNRIPVQALILQIPSINLGPDTVVYGLSFSLDAGSGFTSYLWSTGATTQSISVTTPDTFCVTITDANGCTNNDCVYIDLVTGITNLSKEKLIAVYPNPSKGLFSISLPLNHSKTQIEFFDNTGKILKRIDTRNTPVVIVDLSEEPAGIYYIRVISENLSEVQKLIIE